MIYPATISKEEIALLPVLECTGKTIEIVTTPAQLHEALEVLKQEPYVGFDTETKPSFTKGKRNKLALVQLSNHTTCYLIRINVMGFPDELTQFLSAPAPLKIGLSIQDDYRMMMRRCKFEPQGFVELQREIQRLGILDKGLQRMYAILFGKKISKAQRLSNWEAPLLTEAQQHYAALDAFTCIEIYERIQQDAPFVEIPKDRFVPVASTKDKTAKEKKNKDKTPKPKAPKGPKTDKAKKVGILKSKSKGSVKPAPKPRKGTQPAAES